MAVALVGVGSDDRVTVTAGSTLRTRLPDHRCRSTQRDRQACQQPAEHAVPDDQIRQGRLDRLQRPHAAGYGTDLVSLLDQHLR